MLFIASYYTQLSADIKMKNYKIKTSFFSPEVLKARSKTGINFVIFVLDSWKIILSIQQFLKQRGGLSNCHFWLFIYVIKKILDNFIFLEESTPEKSLCEEYDDVQIKSADTARKLYLFMPFPLNWPSLICLIHFT